MPGASARTISVRAPELRGLPKHLERARRNGRSERLQNIECMPAQMKFMQHGQVSGQVRFQRARIEPDGLIVLCFSPRRSSSSAIPGRSPRRFMIRKIPIMGFTIGVGWALMFG